MVRKNLDLVWDNIAQVENVNLESKTESSNSVNILMNAFSRLEEIRGQNIVIKLPCDIIKSEKKLENFAKDVAILKSLDISMIIVHDYYNITDESEDMLNEKEKFSITQFSNHKSVQFMEMVVSGYINKKITSAINKAGANAVGISGKDCNLIQARKFNIATKRTNEKEDSIIDMGVMGDPTLVNPEILLDMENSDVVTVLAPIAYGENGESFLLDANLTAAIISSSISASRLFILHSDGGIKSQDDKLLSTMNLNDLKSIKNKMEFSREYLDIVEASISSIENYTEFVHLIDSKIDHGMLLNLFTDDNEIGTIISME